MDDFWSTLMAALQREFSDISDVEDAVRIVVRLSVAIILGGLIGVERELQGKAAGLRTHMLVALGSALLCAWAAYSSQFWLLVAATLVAGYYFANAQLYRFAAAELAAPAFKEKAISLVMAGGLLGAIAGPNLAAATRSLVHAKLE